MKHCHIVSLKDESNCELDAALSKDNQSSNT